MAILNFAEQEIDTAPVNKYKSWIFEIETWPNWRISQIYESYQSPSWPNSGLLILKNKSRERRIEFVI